MANRFIVVSKDRAIELGVEDAKDYYDDYRCFLLDTAATPPRLVAADGGEPEDQRFSRDLHWTVSELNNLAQQLANAQA